MFRKSVFMLVLFIVMSMFPGALLAQEDVEERIVNETIADLSDMLNISPDKITVDVMSVMWPNPSLGCDLPENSTSVAMIVSGWRITLTANGEPYYYHASTSGRWAWCPAEYSTIGYGNIATLETVPLSVNLSDISVLPHTVTVQVVFLIMVLGTIYVVHRVNCEHE